MLFSCAEGPAMGEVTPHTPHAAYSPTDDLLGLCPDEVLLVRGQDAQRELLACAALPVHHICALVHVDGALRESCGLQEGRQGHSEAISKGTAKPHRTSPHSRPFLALWLLQMHPTVSQAPGPP